jgi:small subunit ribosomal protein S1
MEPVTLMNEDSKNEQTTAHPTVETIAVTHSVETEAELTPSTEDRAHTHEQQDVQTTEKSVEQGDAETITPVDSPPADDALPADAPATAEPSTDKGPAQSGLADIASLEEAYDHSLKAFSEGEIVKGTVMSVDREEVMVDIGFKSEGYIPVSEFEINADGMPSVNPGDEIDVYIVRREDANGQLILSKEIADQKLVWDDITKAYEEERPVKGKVVQRIKGGLQVNVGKLRAFLPASQIELRPVQDFDQYIGQTIDAKVVKLSKRRRNIVLSRRVILEDELSARKKLLLEELQSGDIRPGVVKSLTTFGAFVDLGGIDGLLHKTDMSWRRVNNPSEVVSVGDTLEVMILSIDRETEKVSLGLKQKRSDPWENIEQKYPIASIVKGRVVSIVNYGAFLELEEGVEGLIHISEMSWTRRNVAPSKIVSKDQIVEAIVLDIDKENQKLSLGLKQMYANPWELLETKYPVGTRIRGRVRNLTDFGAFVEIEEGIDGLIHVSDLSWLKRVVNPREILKEGDEVEVMVLSIDPSAQKISLGLKQIEPDPWLQVPERYKVGSVVRGKIVNLTSFGAFAQLEDGIEGLIHISELASHRVEKPEEIVSVGDELDLKVIHLEPTERRIGLSLKAAREEQERAAVAQYQQQQRSQQQRSSQREEREVTRFGELLQDQLNKSNPEN